MIHLTNDELNNKLSELADKEEFTPDNMIRYDSGKAIAYYGWYWRKVDFDSQISLAYGSAWVGFCQNNKWDYHEFEATIEQSQIIRDLAESFAMNPSKTHATALFDYMQSIRPQTI